MKYHLSREETPTLIKLIVDSDSVFPGYPSGNTGRWVQNDLEIMQSRTLPAIPILAQIDVLLQHISRSETIISDLRYLRPRPRTHGYRRWLTSFPLSRLMYAFGPFGNRLGGGMGIIAESGAGIGKGTLNSS